jgi:sugar transferase (PEP-CTERM/EpsH1 system associated)
MLDAPQLTAEVERVVARHRPDVVLAYCSGMARLALEPPLSRLPYVLDMLDVDSAKWDALASTHSLPWSWVYAREARLLSRFEKTASERAFATLVVTERERQTLASLAPQARVEVVGNGVEADHLRPPGAPSAEPRVVYCGVMNYAPNEAGALWLVREIWPRVRAMRPDATLQIVGAHPTPAVKALAAPGSGVTVTGEVPEVRTYLWAAAVSVAPLQTARGVQNKVLEAVAAGLPVVTTPVVAAGLPDQIAPACLVADRAEEFAGAVASLLGLSAADRRRRAEQANFGSLTWNRQLEPLHAILVDAASRQRRS